VAEGREVVLDAVDEAVHRDLTTTHSHGRGEQRGRAWGEGKEGGLEGEGGAEGRTM
jgi:hypothetical protein